LRKGALWQENISNRNNYDSWQGCGAPDIMKNAYKRATNLLDNHEPECLPQAGRDNLMYVAEQFERNHVAKSTPSPKF